MKKFTRLAMAAAVMMIGTTAFGQTRQTNLAVTLNSPAEGSSLVPNVKVPLTVAIKNNGPGNLVVGDTIFYRTSLMTGTQVGGVILQSAINNGQTLSLTLDTLTNNGTGTTDQTVNFCVRVLDPNTSGLTVGGNPFTATYSDPDTTNNDDCNSIIIKKGTVGIFEFNDKSQEQLTLFPNPASDNISFELNFTKPENVQVSVKDITGREILRKDFGKIQAGNTTPFTLDVSKLRAGMYIIEMNGEERKAVGRFTKR